MITMGMERMDLSLEDHDWLCTQNVKAEQAKYATEVAPKIIAERLVRDIMEFKTRAGGKQNEQARVAKIRIKQLLTQYRDPVWMEEQAMKECVATEYLEDCVQAVWALFEFKQA